MQHKKLGANMSHRFALLLSVAFVLLMGNPANARVDCSAENPLQRDIQCACPKEPLENFATPCISPLRYSGASTFVNTAIDGEGKMSSCKRPESSRSGAVSRTPNTTGPGTESYACATQASGNIKTIEQGCDGPHCRQGAIPAIIEDKPTEANSACVWRQEAIHAVAGGLGAAGLCPATTTTQCNETTLRHPLMTADVVCATATQSAAGIAQPNPNAYRDTLTGTKTHPGTLMANDIARNVGDTGLPRVGSGFSDPLKPTPITPARSYSDGVHRNNDRTGQRAIRTADSRLFPETRAYATYDPHRQDPAKELERALAYAAIPPETVLAQKAERTGGMLSAHASAGTPEPGIVCRLMPDTCHLTSHYDRNPGRIETRYLLGLPRDSAISTPDVMFQTMIGDQMPQLERFLSVLGGEAMGKALFKLMTSAKGDSALTKNDYLQCLTTLANYKNHAESELLLQIASAINQNCPASLLGVLQGLGGLSEANLEAAFQILNPADATKVPATSPMSKLAHFLFNGNINANLGGLTPSNFPSLGGANMPQLSQLLMQQIPNMPTIGALAGNDGRFFGNQGQMPRSLQDLKQTPYARMFFGSHPFAERALMSMFPERAHYSPCASEATCFLGRNEAPFALFGPWWRGGSGVASLDQDLSPAAVRAAQAVLNRTTTDKSCGTEACSLSAALNAALDNAPALLAQHRLRLDARTEILIAAENPHHPDSPINFSANRSHISLGLPYMDEQTGPIITRADGTAFYANMPLKRLNFVAKQQYTIEDVERGILPLQFTHFVPKTASEDWDRLALVLRHDGEATFLSQARLDTLIAETNKHLRENGYGQFYVSRAMYQQNAKPLETYIAMAESSRTMLAEAATGDSKTTLSTLAPLVPAAHADQDAPVFMLASAPLTPTPQQTDAVRCAGQRDHNQISVDILAPRYARFDSQMKQRITANRGWRSGANVPKPCPAGMHPWSRGCWAPTHQPLNPMCYFSAIKVGPSNDIPLASVRYDHGPNNHDIAHDRLITNLCSKLNSPLYKPARGDDCLVQEPDPFCNQTRAHTFFVAPGGKTYYGRTWAFHPEFKYYVAQWAETAGGDFEPDAGEDHPSTACAVLREPVPVMNTIPMASMAAADRNNEVIPMGMAFTSYFGVNKPYVVNDATGLPIGGRDTPLSTAGAYAFGTFAEHSAALNQQVAALPHSSPTAPKIAGLLNRLAPSANASASAARSSKAPCVGGAEGVTGTGCPKAGGADPQSGMFEMALLQASTARDFGHHCMPKQWTMFRNDPTSCLYPQMAGASVQADISSAAASASPKSRLQALAQSLGNSVLANANASNDNPAQPLKRILWPATAMQNALHPQGFNGTGGTEKMEEITDINQLIAMGERAGLAIIQWNKGFGTGEPSSVAGTSKRGFPGTVGIVQSVNKLASGGGSVTVMVSDLGRLRNAAGKTLQGGSTLLTIYTEGALPEQVKSNYQSLEPPFSGDCYDMAIGAHKICEDPFKDVTIYIPKRGNNS
jgi:hypothetical protein